MRFGRLGLGFGSQQRGTSGVSYDAATVAYLAAMGASAPTNPLIKAAYDALIVALKANGHWEKLDWLQLFYTAHTDATDTLINVINPAQTGALVNTPTFAAKAGFSTNGTDNYIRTGFIPAAVGNKYGLVSANGSFMLFGVHVKPVTNINLRLQIHDGTRYLGIRTAYGSAGVFNTRAFCNSSSTAYANRDVEGEDKYYFATGRLKDSVNTIQLFTETTYNTEASPESGIPDPAGAAKDVFIGETNANGVAGSLKVATYPSFFAAGSGYTEAQWYTGATSLYAILEAYRVAMLAI